MVKSKLLSEVYGEQTYWMPDSVPPALNAGRRAYLLPNFDEYIVGYADRRAICDEVHLKTADSRGNVLFSHTIVLDGKIAGTWKRSLTKERVVVDVKPFAPINTTQARNIAGAAERYGTFLGLEAKVSSS
jgi:hypothetical protein